MTDNLKPCPFCAGEPHILEISDADGYNNEGGYVVECKRCGCSSHVQFGYKVDPAPLLISAWNRRSLASFEKETEE